MVVWCLTSAGADGLQHHLCSPAAMQPGLLVKQLLLLHLLLLQTGEGADVRGCSRASYSWDNQALIGLGRTHMPDWVYGSMGLWVHGSQERVCFKVVTTGTYYERESPYLTFNAEIVDG